MVKVGNQYIHSKGTLYEVLRLTKDSETLEMRVVYRALVGTDQETEWDRPIHMWEEPVRWSDGVVRPRFLLIKEVDDVR